MLLIDIVNSRYFTLYDLQCIAINNMFIKY